MARQHQSILRRFFFFGLLRCFFSRNASLHPNEEHVCSSFQVYVCPIFKVGTWLNVTMIQSSPSWLSTFTSKFLFGRKRKRKKKKKTFLPFGAFSIDLCARNAVPSALRTSIRRRRHSISLVWEKTRGWAFIILGYTQRRLPIKPPKSFYHRTGCH